MPENAYEEKNGVKHFTHTLDQAGVNQTDIAGEWQVLKCMVYKM